MTLNLEIKQTPIYSVGLVSPPITRLGDPLTTSCINIDIAGTELTAQCNKNNGELVNANFNFKNCLKNYDGSLSIFDGRNEELFMKPCRVNGSDVACICQQINGSWHPCSKKLDEIFTVINGEIRC
jgi:hypothetical protein